MLLKYRYVDEDFVDMIHDQLFGATEDRSKVNFEISLTGPKLGVSQESKRIEVIYDKIENLAQYFF